jgi:sugar phosphate isomerase/epimerase
MGLCMDIGHTMRVNMDVIQSTKDAGARLLDMHVSRTSNGALMVNGEMFRVRQ